MGEAPSGLRTLVQFLASYPGLCMFKRAYRANMLHKIERYEELLAVAQREVEDAMDVICLKVPDLKRAAGVPATDTSDNWHIFDSVSAPYQSAKDQATRFEAILNRARARLHGSMEVDRVTPDDAAREYRDALVGALEKLTTFAVQGHIVEQVVDVVSSFIKDPRLFRTKLMNFILMGGAGTGKTTLAEAMGDVFAKAGIFVGNKLVLAGRGELVGQYMGETVTKTRTFLVSHLDAGVIFIDEAYAITPWEDGKPESYGTEAAAAMVEFMTRYQGLYCIITAGYEREMVRYFLPSNEGLARRFPHKLVLCTMTADDMVAVFRRQLLRARGYPITHEDAETYFTADAYAYLRALIDTALQGDVVYVDEDDSATRKRYERTRRFRPRWAHMYKLFEHQAGSMANLADEAVTVLYTTMSFRDVMAFHKKKGKNARPRVRCQDRAVMRRIVLQRIRNTALSDAHEFLRQFLEVEAVLAP